MTAGPDTDTDVQLASFLAEQAGQLLVHIKSTANRMGESLGKLGDQDSNELILAALAKARPDDAVLSEESADSPARLSADRVWIIDPLDGTREFGLPGRDDWAVHVALWERGRGITAAAVSVPALYGLYASDDAVLAPPVHPSPRFLVSASRPPAWAAPVAAELGAELVPMGSAGAKAMAVLRGEADAYLHDGGQWEWDSAAPVGVVQAAGLHASRIDGSPLRYNRAHPYLPDLLICRSDLAGDVLAAIGRATA